MAYAKTTWKDRVVEKPRTYSKTDNPDGTITLTPAPGTILEIGTPVSAVNMNKLETQYETALADVQELTRSFTVKAGESVTAKDVVEYVNGGLRRSTIHPDSVIKIVEACPEITVGTNGRSSFVAMSDDTILHAYNGQYSYPRVRVGKLEDDRITFGSDLILNSANGETHTAVFKLDATRAIVFFYTPSPVKYIKACIVTMSGMSVSAGTAVNIITEPVYSNMVAVEMATGSIALLHRSYDMGGTHYMKVQNVSVSGTTITAGTALNITGTYAFDEIPDISALSSNKCIIAFNSGTNPYTPQVRIATLSGTTFSVGAAVSLQSASAYKYDSRVLGVSDTKAIVSRRAASSQNMYTLTVSGSTASLTYSDSISAWVATVEPLYFLDPGRKYFLQKDVIFAIMPDGVAECRRTGLGTTFTYVVYPGCMLLYTADLVRYAFLSVPSDSIVGIAKETKSAGQSCAVSIAGVASGLSGLTPGTVYYKQMDGSFGPVLSDTRIGVAISATELLRN